MLRLPPVLRLSLVTLLVGAALWWPSRHWGGPEAVRSLLWAMGIVWAGALAGHGVFRLLARKLEGPTAVPNALMAGLGARLFTTLIPVAVIAWQEPFPLMPFALQAGTLYMALMALEVLGNVREFGQNPPASGTTDGDAAPNATDPTPPPPEASSK